MDIEYYNSKDRLNVELPERYGASEGTHEVNITITGHYSFQVSITLIRMEVGDNYAFAALTYTRIKKKL